MTTSWIIRSGLDGLLLTDKGYRILYHVGKETGTRYYPGDYIYPKDVEVITENGIRKAFLKFSLIAFEGIDGSPKEFMEL